MSPHDDYEEGSTLDLDYSDAVPLRAHHLEGVIRPEPIGVRGLEPADRVMAVGGPGPDAV